MRKFNFECIIQIFVSIKYDMFGKYRVLILYYLLRFEISCIKFYVYIVFLNIGLIYIKCCLDN